MSTVLKLENVTKMIRGKKLIDQLSFEVKAGEVFGFLGPNGAGKTTTIRMIVGLTNISSGDIIICGKNIKKNYADAVQHIGAIVENPELYPFLTGYQNLKQYARMAKGVTTERINEVIELVGLKDRIHNKVKTYSLGMRQRLGLAQSLLHDPKILILDEPTNGLDPAGIREIRDYLRKLAKEKEIAVIVSSHLLSEMEMMCDRIAIIQQGKLVDVQPVKDFVHQTKELYRIRVHPLQKATTLLVKQQFSDLKQTEECLLVSTEEKNIPNIIHLLSTNDIQIFEAAKVTKTLEDRFLEVTNGERSSMHA
ncbi:ABC transporter ATP-binding protein [Bacillus chungangensis]|uniref:ABC-2 type transport system ATP-binding protein n=1 Tax=Bacillus chungangensis TaxID=587633 RepID=A0ABT9WMS4_9BACI|nr:ABC transporter ATP-binding protein [Bacillus chungangensis]MDQ0174272.1 ABC-2 type transport system ATP-binding protein [Bacillus chungangensis]